MITHSLTIISKGEVTRKCGTCGGAYSQVCGCWIQDKMDDDPHIAWYINTLMQRVTDYEEVNLDKRRLVREIDVIMNGEAGAAKQSSLCDLVPQIRDLVSFRTTILNSIPQHVYEQRTSND